MKGPEALMNVPRKRIDRTAQHRSLAKLILDLNPRAPVVSEIHGHRER